MKQLQLMLGTCRFKSQLCGHVEIGQSMSAPLENSIITTPGQGCPSGRSPTIGTTRKFTDIAVAPCIL